MAKKKSKLDLRIIFLILITVILFLVLISSHSSNVLGTNIAAGKQLQIDWLRFPFINQSPAPSTTPTQSTTPIASPVASSSIIAGTIPPFSPNPTTPCIIDGGAVATNCTCSEYLVYCQYSQCLSVVTAPGARYGQSIDCKFVNEQEWCKSNYKVLASDYYCMAKPVIYLYPQQKTLVDVKVTADNGQVVVSDPQYDSQFQGWDDVLAYPDGNLEFLGRSYRELFYETSVKEVAAPNNGLVIERHQLEAKLREVTTKLGLNKFEQQEFLNYWLPTLEDLNSPYILFSLIGSEEKKRVDNVTISPNPDTFIYVLAYFKPLNSPIKIKPLVLPNSPPDRVGFVAVEWGGTIDRH